MTHDGSVWPISALVCALESLFLCLNTPSAIDSYNILLEGNVRCIVLYKLQVTSVVFECPNGLNSFIVNPEWLCATCVNNIMIDVGKLDNQTVCKPRSRRTLNTWRTWIVFLAVSVTPKEWGNLNNVLIWYVQYMCNLHKQLLCSHGDEQLLNSNTFVPNLLET